VISDMHYRDHRLQYINFRTDGLYELYSLGVIKVGV
jgi:hypothetical protein